MSAIRWLAFWPASVSRIVSCTFSSGSYLMSLAGLAASAPGSPSPAAGSCGLGVSSGLEGSSGLAGLAVLSPGAASLPAAALGASPFSAESSALAPAAAAALAGVSACSVSCGFCSVALTSRKGECRGRELCGEVAPSAAGLSAGFSPLSVSAAGFSAAGLSGVSAGFSSLGFSGVSDSGDFDSSAASLLPCSPSSVFSSLDEKSTARNCALLSS